MNRTLLYFSLILIIVGLILGVYLIAFVGFLLLIPSVLTTSRPPAKPSPAPAREAPRHAAPPPANKPEAVPSPGQPMSMPMTAATVSFVATGQSYSSALFPTPLMPSLSLMGMGSVSQLEKEVVPAKHEGRDDLIEVAAILALLKLISS